MDLDKGREGVLAFSAGEQVTSRKILYEYRVMFDRPPRLLSTTLQVFKESVIIRIISKGNIYHGMSLFHLV
jgi:hypothetical protein